MIFGKLSISQGSSLKAQEFNLMANEMNIVNGIRYSIMHNWPTSVACLPLRGFKGWGNSKAKASRNLTVEELDE